tara:strand:+ start:2032 stop:2244 length:213 start_codon:yes stop_codon:yes gene_type:complete
MYDWYFERQKAIKPYGSNKPHRGVSQKLKYCKPCNSVWERDYHSKCILLYKDFPTLGLVRKKCENCEGEE